MVFIMDDIPDESKKILENLREEVDKNERMIQVRVALDYLLMLIEPEYRKAFEDAEKKATTPEELAELLVLAKKHIGQKNLIKLLGLDKHQ